MSVHNLQWTACMESFKAYINLKGNIAKRNTKGKHCISKWEQQVGEHVMVKCKAVSDAMDGIIQQIT
jgi:hypothetical protein